MRLSARFIYLPIILFVVMSVSLFCAETSVAPHLLNIVDVVFASKSEEHRKFIWLESFGLKQLSDLKELTGDEINSPEMQLYLADQVLHSLVIRLNSYHPALAIKENLARLLSRDTINREEVESAVYNFVHRDYAKIYRFTEGIDSIAHKFSATHPYANSRYMLISKEEHCAKTSQINHILSISPPEEAAQKIFDLFPLEEDNPFWGLSPDKYVALLDEARSASAEFVSLMRSRVRVRQITVNELENEVLRFWDAFPAASGSLFAGIVGHLTSKRHPSYAGYVPELWDNNPGAVFQVIPYGPVKTIQVLHARANMDHQILSESDEMRLLSDLYAIGKMEDLSFQNIQSRIDKYKGKYMADMRQRVENLEKMRNEEGVNSSGLRFEESMIESRNKFLQEFVLPMEALIEDKTPQEAVRFAQAMLLAHIYSRYGCDYIPAMDLVDLYHDARESYPKLLDRLEADPTLTNDRLRKEIAAYWERNPIAAAFLGKNVMPSSVTPYVHSVEFDNAARD